MAVKFGEFVGKNGHEYVVEIEGANVEYGEVTLGVPPVTISMAASEHKGVGYKSTTAVVNIITDKPLADLYSSTPTDVKLTVTDMTTGDFLFVGYVVPFVFNQAFTGKADTFTLNAVDLLTALKGEKYANIGEPYGTDRMALDIVQAIAERSGIVRIVEHINFDTIDPNNGTSPLGLSVAQAGFLQDEVSDLDALSAICKFVGYTSCVVGNVLYLYDEHCLLHADDLHARNAAVWDLRNGAWVERYRYFNSADTPLATQQVGTIRNDINVTIERAWDGIQITTEGSYTSLLLPDVCDEEYLTDAPDVLGSQMREDYQQVGDTEELYVARRIPAYSSLLNLGKGASGGVTSWPPSSGDYLRPNNGVNQTAGHWDSGSMMVQFGLSRIGNVDGDGTEIPVPLQTDRWNMLWVRAESNGNTVLSQRTDKAYSHTGGIVGVDLRVRITYNSNYIAPDGDNLILAERGHGNALRWPQIKVGNQYLDWKHEWQSSVPQIGPLSVDSNGKLTSSVLAAGYMQTGHIFATPNNGQVLFQGIAKSGDGIIDYYIESLKIEGVGDAVNTEHPDMRHQYASSEAEFLEAKTMLTTRASGAEDRLGTPYGVNARPAVVTDTEWPGGYMGRKDTESIPISGILMEQLRERYAIPRPRYQMTVEGNINPYASVVFGGRGYTVEAYERDLYNDTTNITIN